MRIGLITEKRYPPIHRSNKRVIYLGKTLAAAGDEVYVFFPSDKSTAEKQEGLNLIGIRAPTGGNEWLRRISFIISATFFISSFVRKRKIDLLYGWNFVPNLIAMLTGTRFIADMTDFGFDLMKEGKVLPGPIISAIRFLECKAIPNSCQRLIVVSDLMKDKIVEFSGIAPAKVRVVNDGVNIAEFGKPDGRIQSEIMSKYGIRPDDFVILHIGDIEYHDGVDLLIDAFKRMRKKRGHLKLLLVGPGRKYFETLKAKHAGDKDIIFTKEELPNCIHLSSACTICLRPALNANSILTFKIFEYWAHRKPAVVPDLVTLGKLAKENAAALVFRPGSSVDLQKQLERLVRDAALRKRLARNGYGVAKRYAWEKVLKPIPSIFHSQR
jgi:glycosyltransferase involved in cell wall biosynthesis